MVVTPAAAEQGGRAEGQEEEEEEEEEGQVEEQVEELAEVQVAEEQAERTRLLKPGWWIYQRCVHMGVLFCLLC